MKTIQTLILMILIPFCVSAKSDSVVISQLEKKIENVEKQNETQENTLNELISKVDSASSTLEFYQHKIDSLKENLATTNATTTKLGTDISDAKSQALKDKDELSKNIDNKTMIGLIGIILLLLILVSVYLLLKKRIKTSSSSIASIKQTQQKIKETQKQLQEENVKLDAKLVEILEKQIESRKAINITSKEESNEIDHSLVLKIAGVGLIVSVACQILQKNGRDEQATFVAIAGVVIATLFLVKEISNLFSTLKSVFGL